MSMFDDPLNPSNGFGDEPAVASPPWPTTPHAPNSPFLDNLRRASSPNPPTPEKGPSLGPFGQEPQIYGQPESGLISPRDAVSPNGENYEKPEPYLRVRITGLDRNRRDILVKLDAQTNLPNFTGTTYRNVSRSYLEFQQLYDSLVTSNPQTIIHALPLAQTSAPTDEEDDRLVKIMLQRWIARVCEDPILLNDEDLRSFVENDFGYQPTPKPRRKGGSGFGLMRRGVPDEDEDLQRARFELTKLEGQFFDTAKAVDKLSLARKSLAVAHAEMGNKLINVATTEAHPPLGNAFRKIGRTWHSLADLDQAQAISECVIIGDSLGYQGMNARSAKETLLMRTGVLEEYQAAVKSTISKRRQIERLKASSNIRPERVDEALEEMEEADKYEQTLARRAQGISQNLHQALQTHNRYANDDITTALIEHTRSSIMYERQLLRELEALRTDVASAASKWVPPVNGVPKPPVIPGLEESLKPTPPPPKVVPPPPVPASNGPLPSNGPLSNGPFPNGPLSNGPLANGPLSNGPPLSNGSRFAPGTQPPPPHIQTPPQRAPFQSFGQSLANPLGNNTIPPSPGPPSASSTQAIYDRSRDPLTPSSSQSSYNPSPSPSISSFRQPSVAGSSLPPSPRQAQTPTAAANGPPLGGRLVDGSKSMFIKPPTSPVAPSPLAASTSSPLVASPATPTPQSFANVDPLLGTGITSTSTLSRSTASPLYDSPLGGGAAQRSRTLTSTSVNHVLRNELDPLGQTTPTPMAASVRQTPQRPRLDAREAAKSLANMF